MLPPRLVPMVRGNVAIPEERPLLFLHYLVGPAYTTAEGGAPSYYYAIGSVCVKEVPSLWSDVQRALCNWCPSAAKGAQSHPELSKLDEERCFTFIMGSINCHVRAYSAGILKGVNDSDYMENSLTSTYWGPEDILRLWGEMGRCLLLVKGVDALYSSACNALAGRWQSRGSV